jgi:hypothetical protein
MIIFFLNILFFKFWEKSDVEREIIWENFRKNDMWKGNNRRKFWKKTKRKKTGDRNHKKRGKKILGKIVEEKKDLGRKFRKIILWIVPLHGKRILSSPSKLERPPVNGEDGLRRKPKAIKLACVLPIKI